jgi:mannose-6-phosphate isomerase-like protein (cupin superfamily)
VQAEGSSLITDNARGTAERINEIQCRRWPILASLDVPSRQVGGMWCEVAGGDQSGIDLHEEWEVVVCVGGNGHILIEGSETVELCPGRAVLVPSNVPHRYRNASETEPFQTASIFWIGGKDETACAHLTA